MEVFELQKFLTVFFTPLGMAIVVTLLGLALSRRWIVLCAMAWLWVWSTPWAAIRLAETIEAQNPLVLAATLPPADVIVVLGGAISPGVPHWHPDINLGEASDRIFKAAELYQLHKAPQILYSGGPTNDTGGSEAKSAAELLTQLGVAASAITVETNSRTTRENAAFSLPLLKAMGAHQVLLVSSAWHLPRATDNFRDAARAEGLDLTFTPVPCDPAALAENSDRLRRWLPDTEALNLSRQMFKELLGRAHAKLFDRQK